MGNFEKMPIVTKNHQKKQKLGFQKASSRNMPINILSEHLTMIFYINTLRSCWIRQYTLNFLF